MRRYLLSLPIEQLVFIAVMIIAILGLALTGSPRTQGAVDYATNYSTGKTPCTLTGFDNGMSVTIYQVKQQLELQGTPCYQVANNEDWFCCVPTASHWTTPAQREATY